MKSLKIILTALLCSTLAAPAFTAVGTQGQGIQSADRSPFLTALGGTTAGKALFQLANPGAITFLRVNADNTVSALNATDFKTAIGATSSAWGAITGTLASQTDLNSALALKAPLVSPALTGTPTLNGTPLGTAATTASTAYATAAQGTKADTAIQPPATTIIGGLLTAGAVANTWVKPFTRFTKLAAFGDSIVQTGSNWVVGTYLGTYPNGLDFKARSAFTDVPNINLVSVISGNNTALSVVVSGKTVTINLATDGAGVSTSTNTLVKAALDASIPFQDLGLTTSFYNGTDNSLFAVSGTVAMSRPLAVSTNYLATGYTTYAQILLNGKFDFVRRPVVTGSAMVAGDWSFGVSGATSLSLAANPGPLGDLLTAAKAVGATVLEHSGSNDVQGGASTAADIRDRRKALWDYIESEGLQVIATEILPLGPSANGTTVTLATAQARTVLADAANALCKTEAQSRGILWIEWPGSLRASSAASNVYFTDGIHPNELGAQVIGAAFATAITPYVATTNVFMPPEGSKKWLSANPQVRGGATNATSWNAPTGPVSGTSTASKQTISAETWQRITITQANGSTFNLVAMGCTATTVAAGQRIRIMGRFKVSAGFRNVSVQVTYNNNGGALVANRTYGVGSLTSSLTAFDGTLLSPFDDVPYGVTSATLAVYAYGAGTVDFRDLGIVLE
jgi:lysophospholipase L1-like esterase